MHHSPRHGRRSSAARLSHGKSANRYSTTQQSPAIGKSPRQRGNEKRLKELCAELVPILGIEPATIFFTDQRAQSFEKFKDAFQELKFFYCAVIKTVLGKSERIIFNEDDTSRCSTSVDDPTGPSLDLYQGVKLYRLTCNALFALKIKPLPSFLEYSDPSAAFLVRVAERIIDWYVLQERCRHEEQRVNSMHQNVRIELQTKRATLDSIRRKIANYETGQSSIKREHDELEHEKDELRRKIGDTYDKLSKKRAENQELDRSFKEYQDRLSAQEHRSLEIQSQIETLQSNVVKSPGRCIKELESIRQRNNQERLQLRAEEDESLVLKPVLECSRNCKSIAEVVSKKLDETDKTRKVVENVDSDRIKLEAEYQKNQEKLQKITEEVHAADAELRELDNLVMVEMTQLKNTRSELLQKRESIRRELQTVHKEDEIAREGLKRKQREHDAKKNQLNLIREKNKEEIQKTVDMIEEVVQNIENKSIPLDNLFNQRFKFHEMDWLTFKSKVQTAPVEDDDDEENEHSADSGYQRGARKSVDFNNENRSVRHRRRSSVMAEEIANEILSEMENRSKQKSAMNMTSDEIQSMTKKLFLERIASFVYEEGWNNNDLNLKACIPKAVLEPLERAVKDL